jgi:TonB family protein
VQKEKKDKNFIKKPTFPGGARAMRKLIASKLTYPPEALKAKIEGTVTIRYTIDRKGQVIKCKVISGIGYGCDEEAVRLVNLLKFQVPRQPQKRLLFHKTIHIHFKLPEKKEKKVTYHYDLTSKKANKAVDGYQYTIDIGKN